MEKKGKPHLKYFKVWGLSCNG